MASVHITDIGDEDTVVATGLFIALCINGEGEEMLQIVSVGDPKPWTKQMLAQAAYQRTSEQMKNLWKALD